MSIYLSIKLCVSMCVYVCVSSFVWVHIFYFQLKDYTRNQAEVVVAKGRPN